jgi:hypothetical protein
MSEGGIQFLLYGFIPLLFIALWIWTEVKSRSRPARLAAGCIGSAFSLAAGAFQFIRLLLWWDAGASASSIIDQADPRQSKELQQWAANYKFYRGFEHHVKERDRLEKIINRRN